MTGCLLLGPPDEKVAKVRETPTGPKEKRIPTSFIDDAYYANPKVFFFFVFIFYKYPLYPLQQHGEYCADKGFRGHCHFKDLGCFFFFWYYNFRFQFNNNITNVFYDKHKK